ncbi:MAG TPA: alpha/beta hydrolase, partial [Acidimicrobiales bacterium]|nr:alpha/beta hydrolase [Acidimicrobiales bacterium]
GSMDRASSFRRVIARLPDFTVISYDRRGYAGSAEVPPASLFDRQVGDLVEVLGRRTVVGVGHSLGGDVVLAAAQRHRELIDTAMVFEPPQPWLRSWSERPSGSAAAIEVGKSSPRRAAEMFMRGMVGDGVWDRLSSSTQERRRAEGATLVAELQALRSGRPVFDAASITIPVVCGYGSRSRPHQKQGTRHLAEALPLGELHCIEGSTHGAHLSHPGAIATLIRRALARRDEAKQ